ncbi:uncharacterized protein SPSK_09884 [Sporothrix schenckii 1099-18]|uniref:Uncharacterized protein n=1 Tax=Sporothrix schenckii 1099-18 TaxID=1397361 RepID=A0A0F2M4N6_SPOSC|nr:uncharacterized protein SPSK_09884 [Sporothrix schenckii 1099-18]KJR84582.1 hypothetical protein SPSK_09884 [Sporothrix schenckii 1099-18]
MDFLSYPAKVIAALRFANVSVSVREVRPLLVVERGGAGNVTAAPVCDFGRKELPCRGIAAVGIPVAIVSHDAAALGVYALVSVNAEIAAALYIKGIVCRIRVGGRSATCVG